MITKNSQKLVKKYNCETCHYICCKKNDYAKHLTTTKHINSYIYLQNSPKINTIKKNTCTCGKEYNHRQGLYTHKKKCKGNTISDDTNTDLNNIDDTNMKDIILNMIKSNEELQKQMIEVCKTNNNSTNIINTNNTNNTINSNNKTFNLQVFLNEQCKDAINLTDFISSIELKLSDLENMEKLGYTDCMFNNIFGNMDILDICSRPFHCSDLKREIIYIKDNDVWEKEDAEHSKLKNAIRTIEKKNFKLLNEWTEKHPTFRDYDSPYNDKYLKIVGQTMSGDKEHMDKVIRKLAKNCVIDKSI